MVGDFWRRVYAPGMLRAATVSFLLALLLASLWAPERIRAAADEPNPAVDKAIKDLELIRPRRSTAPKEFSVPAIPEGTFRLSEQRGSVVLVNFWATWCQPCREEMPALQRLWQRYKDRRLVVVGISIDTDPAVIPKFVASYRLSFPMGHDGNKKLADSFGARAMPTTLVVNTEGYLVALAFGERPWDGKAAIALIDALLR